MRYAYFPGCSLKGTGRAYEESLLLVMQRLGVELKELDEWNCCGATAYMSIDESKACVLAARNLALAERSGLKEVVAPCSACYLVLNKAQRLMDEYPQVRAVTKGALEAAGLKLTSTVKVRHPLEILIQDVGLDVIRKHVVRPLNGVKVIPYYGCQIVRPYAFFDDQANPTSMDRILEALGASVVNWPLKTKCCGGSLTGTISEAGFRLVYILLREGERRGADVISVICPLCQFNLDAYQDLVSKRWGRVRMPTVYLTQLMGLAFGFKQEELGLHRNLVRAKTVEAKS